MALWNQKYIPLPPICSEIYNVQDIDKDKLLNARGGLHSALQDWRGSLLLSERWLIRRLCYKSKNQLRRKKCIARFKQVAKCLTALKGMNLDKCLANLISMIPNQLSSTMNTVHLPSKPVVEYVLLRLLGAVLVLQQSIGYCTSSYILVTQQLSQGLFSKQMTIIAAIVSRVWVICRSLIESFRQCYQNLYVWMQELRPGAMSLISSDDQLPTDVCNLLSINDSSRDHSTFSEHSSRDHSTVSEHSSRDHSTVSEHKLSKEVEMYGEPIDREKFKNMITECHGTAAPSVTSMPPTISRCSKSRVTKRVRRFLSPDSASPQSSPELTSTIRRPTETDLRRCRSSVQECSNMAQLYLVMSELNRSNPGVKFLAMRSCLAKLRKLKSARYLGKESSIRRRDNERLMRRGKKIVTKFLEKNNRPTIIPDTQGVTGKPESDVADEAKTGRKNTKSTKKKTKPSVKRCTETDSMPCGAGSYADVDLQIVKRKTKKMSVKNST